MKKLFLLVPALVLTLFANAEVINITPTSPHSSNNLRQVLAEAVTGDIIEMAAGTYVETGNWLAIDDKAVTVRAAEGAEVIIKPEHSVRVKAGSVNQIGKAEFIGVKFDCSALVNEYLFIPSDDKANQSVVLKNCELYDWTANSALIQTSSERRLDVIDIDNCYFHGFEKSIIFLQNTNPINLSVTNSTFANVSGSITNSYYAAPIYVKAPTSGSVLVDHCTFYDVMPMSLSYGVITVDAISDVLVSNCIFARSSSADMCTTNLPTGSNVKNCLTWYYDNWQAYGHYETATVTDCVKANPLFKNAAGGDFSLFASSPARGAGLAGSNLGDPRWAPALTPIAIPATLVPFDALLSEKASIIQSDPDSIFLQTESKTVIEWAKWRVSVAKSGLYDFTAYAKRTNPTGSQRLQIVVLNSAENETLKSKSETGLPTECTLSSGAVNLEAGNTYVIKVLNNYDWAKSKLIKVEATYAGGAIVNIPGQILCEEAVICQVDGGHTPKMYHLENGDLKYNDNGYNLEEYAYWNINATEAGEMAVTLNVANSGHIFSLELYQGETRLDSIGEIWEGDERTLWEDGDITLPNTLTFPSAGSYRLKLLNNQANSGGVLHGITFAPYVAPAGVTMTDTDTDNTAWVAHLDETSDVQLNRTILGGMYNTICLPFTVSSGKCKAIFGSDVELYTLGSATISGDILNLQFNTSSDIWKGTPILIKTSTDIVNPLFEGVTIERETADRTTREAVTFRGTFVQKDFHNGDQVLLLVANNMLSYPLSDRTLKGFRAYFEINNPEASAPIRGARIIAGEQVVTSIDLVDAQTERGVKIIENGQLIIIRDGVHYNALGVQVE